MLFYFVLICYNCLGDNMIPYVNIFGKQISMYLIMAIIGIFVAGPFAIYEAKKKGKDSNEILVILLISAIGLFIGGHLLYGITNLNTLYKVIIHFNKIESFKQFINIFIYIFGGQVFYGGLIGGLITAYFYIKKKNYDSKTYFDIGAFTIPLFHFFARIGCFLSGCCYGVESHVGFMYKHAIVESANGVSRFPIQLVEASFNFLLFIFIYILYKKEKLKGNLIYLYLSIYAIARFIIEFFRGDDYRGFLFGISTSQFISILILLFVIVNIIKKKIKK